MCVGFELVRTTIKPVIIECSFAVGGFALRLLIHTDCLYIYNINHTSQYVCILRLKRVSCRRVRETTIYARAL